MKQGNFSYEDILLFIVMKKSIRERLFSKLTKNLKCFNSRRDIQPIGLCYTSFNLLAAI